jgi:hypothetical protein
MNIAAVGNSPTGDIGNMQHVLLVAGTGYAFGGLLFGIALFRAGILARWASLLLASATIAVLALSVLPDAFNRPFAVPAGVAMIGLGVSLWRNQRRARTVTSADIRVRPTTASGLSDRPATLTGR